MKLINSILISDVHILKNVSDFLSSLTLIDVIFFFSIILLMILVVVLLYFIKVNEDDNTDEEVINSSAELSNIKEENNEEQSSYVDEGELVDLTSITKALENLDNSKIDLTAFEEEQEKDAIISYDELISKSKTGSINYKNETMMDDLSVKEVDLDNLINEANKEKVTTTVKTSVISYAQEEAFLEALKKLQKQLN